MNAERDFQGFVYGIHTFNSLWFSDAISSGSTLAQVSACCWTELKPLPEPMLTYWQLTPLGTSMNILTKIQIFSLKKMSLKMMSAECQPFCASIKNFLWDLWWFRARGYPLAFWAWTNVGAPFLTHWGRVMHICVSKLTIIGSDNGLSPGRHQAIIWTNAGILLIGPLGTNFSEILVGIQTFSFRKMHLKMLSVL